jgi:signal transduction histidine kinase
MALSRDIPGVCALVRLLNRLKIKQKLAVVLAVAAVALVGSVVSGAVALYQRMYFDRVEQTRQMVEAARGAVQSWYEKEQSGTLSESEAQARAIATLRGMRYGSDGYFAINTYDGVTMLHPNRPELEGTKRIDVTDPNGVPHVRLQIERARSGGGFIEYLFPRMGSNTPVPKLYYAAAFEPWRWVIGTGAYIDDIDGEFRASLMRLAAIAAGIFALAAAAAMRVSQNITRSLGRLKTDMERLAAGDLAVDIVEAERRDEVGDMAKAMRVFKDHAVAARQLAAEQERRQQLEAMVSHADRVDELGRLAGGIAHDLNNALVPVLAMTKTVMTRLPSESRDRASLELALMGAYRARELVQQVLAFSRKQQVEMREFDLADVVRDGIKLLRASLPATIKLVSRLEPVPAIHGDPGQLNQVLVNLVSNGAQAIGERAGTVTVSLRPLDAARVRLAVEDTGCGMDAATRARMFEPFFTTKAPGQGTGLGLAVVQGIIASHGGTIDAESEIGKGTRIAIDLPAIRPAEALAA